MSSNNLGISQDSIQHVKMAAADTAPVSGLTHTFYRYPARFSPQFARAAIQAFTKPNDLVLDPFMGGGTTMVEALALGRRAMGTDISSLAVFISKVKTTLLSQYDYKALNDWIFYLPYEIRLNKKTTKMFSNMERAYRRNLDNPDAWRIRKGIDLGLETLSELNNKRQEQFARCVLLKTGQWALDGRKEIPSISEFRDALGWHFEEMIGGARQLNSLVQSHHKNNDVKCINRSAIGLEMDNRILLAGSPDLILTSPPYPGIHVLYHRWQINGGRESPIPFSIANKLDGSGAAYYTMGSRKQKGLTKYFNEIGEAFKSLAAISSEKTIVIQMISFSQPVWQLPKYLEAMSTAGFTEIIPDAQANNDMNGRIWRDVPQRKWHANFKGKTHGSKELVLFHRLSH